MPPVYESRSGNRPQVAKNVRARDIERVLVVVGGKHIKSGARRRQRAEAYSAAELQRAFSAALQLQELAREDDRRGPHVGPVGKPFVFDKVFLANEVVRVRRPENAERVLVNGRVLDRCPKPSSERADKGVAVKDGARLDLR